MIKKELIQLVDKYNLKERNRKRNVVYQRQFMMYELSKYCTLSETGRILNISHCTVIYGIRQHKQWMEAQDADYLKAIDDIYMDIYGSSIDDIADQNIYVHVNGIYGHRVDVSIRFVTLDVSAFHKLNDIMTREEFKSLL
jgi:hypothetical protein